MTIFANKSGPGLIKVGITYGPVSTYIEENTGHLRHFHEQLGKLLDEAAVEAEAKGKADTDA